MSNPIYINTRMEYSLDNYSVCVALISVALPLLMEYTVYTHRHTDLTNLAKYAIISIIFKRRDILIFENFVTRRSSKGRDMVTRYVANRVAGINKTASARLAGYKMPNSVVTQIEKTNNFREITSKILANNSNNAILMIDSIEKAIKKGELDNYPLNVRIKMLLELTNIQKNLSPDLRIKETIDDKGKITRTMWNTASPMQAQAITTKPLENIDNNNVAQSTFTDVENPLINKDIETPRSESFTPTPNATP